MDLKQMIEERVEAMRAKRRLQAEERSRETRVKQEPSDSSSSDSSSSDGSLSDGSPSDGSTAHTTKTTNVQGKENVPSKENVPGKENVPAIQNPAFGQTAPASATPLKFKINTPATMAPKYSVHNLAKKRKADGTSSILVN
jgi:hypothetical protein